MNKVSLSGGVYNSLKKNLDASALTSKVIANNIANINTKGYKRMYVSFEEALNESEGSAGLKATNTKHMNVEGSKGNKAIKKDLSTSMRQDGNNVDIDIEKTNQAANTLMFNALITEVNTRLSLRSYIIKGGK